MTFNSLTFALFLPTVFVLHWALPRRLRLPLIVLASYLFYGAWDWRFLGLLWVSTAVDFFVGIRLDRTSAPRVRKGLLGVSLATNLGILATFKYFDFFTQSAADFLTDLGLGVNPPLLEVLLPVGISFYTFQTLAYTIEVYRGRVEACHSPVLFAAYVAFFPQLVAGPIERAQALMPQLAADRPRPSSRQVESALLLILIGLVKKVVIADQLAPLVDEAWQRPSASSGVALAVAAMAFAVQVYADFSGYTDIARGSARLLGVELVHNFEEPFLATDFTNLWRRWHTSLTGWFRDFVYIPLGGNRGTRIRTNLNLLIVWAITGLWHGAAWTFVFWGALSGALIIAHRIWRGRSHIPADENLPEGIRGIGSAFGTFVLFAATLIPFRSPDLATAWTIFSRIVTLQSGARPDYLFAVVGSASVVAIAIDVIRRRARLAQREALRSVELRGALAGMAVLAIFLSSGDAPEPFIYFQF